MTRCGFEQFFRIQTEPLNRRVNARPMLVQKFLAFAFDQQIARAGFHKHSKAAPSFDQIFADQLLVSFQDREWIHSIFRCDIADRRQRIAFVEHAIENHVNDTIPELAINRLTIIPLTRHFVLRFAPGTAAWYLSTGSTARIDLSSSYSDIVNYNTISRASTFYDFFGEARTNEDAQRPTLRCSASLAVSFSALGALF